ncbi:condensin-2 complex subunit H2-like [Diprion similis]|uniref:condensin-2 complex subunit H2-like n=1 Tax=Diprion similis TaxID=362088 RepID=UPI001EF7DFC9|nr:condensin-2 complex subunit H2-like [Diprion similis]XP_046743842.1 condensin-2 complex subunit H2-like [Diprion similis]XP_046743843.1 condensin-2 complex subunit H2-like [Diprion similis]XP_046743844.1 condensin-2 complex subunit H2-like [Diprion similis]XP_046743845.1 condensin-2 complex subunit H2-like [Diprion similis]
METLLKPAKLLAEWDSNFAQSLEKYFILLKATQNVNFGEAALVIQNSANVYARRVEYLQNETEALNQSLIIHNDGADSEETTAKKKKYQKSNNVIDFNDFESLELSNQIGKSSNLKEGAQKTLKLLTRRFTQLESNLAQLSSPIEILSIQGEVIGNKYDFRCNQQLTKNCMLVDELTPNDFGQPSLTVSPNYQTTANDTPNMHLDSAYGSMFDNTETAETPACTNSEEIESNVIDSRANKNIDESCDIPNDADAGYTSDDAQDAVEPQLTSSTTVESTQTKDNTNQQILEPIPFENGIPDPIPRRRTQFKLPCHVSLLKSKSRKRKNLSENKKREHLTRFLLNRYELAHKKLKVDSPTRQLFAPMKKEEFEEFQKSFDQYLKNMRGCETDNYEAVSSSLTRELLGFQRNFGKRDPLTERFTYTADDSILDSSMIIEPESDLSSVPESFTTPPPTPEAANHGHNYRELVEQRIKQIGEETREQSDLEQRVAEWHRSLRPKLVAAERRPAFHMHEYSSRIIEALEATGSRKLPFGNLIKNQSTPEVARYFLASLQLANSYDIAINATADSGCGIELKLLEQEKHPQTFDPNENIDRLPISEISNDCTMLRISTS